MWAQGVEALMSLVVSGGLPNLLSRRLSVLDAHYESSKILDNVLVLGAVGYRAANSDSAPQAAAEALPGWPSGTGCPQPCFRPKNYSFWAGPETLLTSRWINELRDSRRRGFWAAD